MNAWNRNNDGTVRSAIQLRRYDAIELTFAPFFVELAIVATCTVFEYQELDGRTTTRKVQRCEA
jgi:hypothetical protein